MCSNQPQRTCKWNESIIQSADAADAADADAVPDFDFIWFFFSGSFFWLGRSILFFSIEMDAGRPAAAQPISTVLCVWGSTATLHIAVGSDLVDSVTTSLN